MNTLKKTQALIQLIHDFLHSNLKFKKEDDKIVIDYRKIEKYAQKKEIPYSLILTKDDDVLDFCSCDLSDTKMLWFILKKIQEGYEIKEFKFKEKPAIIQIDKEKNKIKFLRENVEVEIKIRNRIVEYYYTFLDMNNLQISFGEKI